MIQLMIAAACGWFLLVAPMKQVGVGNFEVDEKRPYGEWEQRQAFDMAEECEAKRHVILWDAMIAIAGRAKESRKQEQSETEAKAEHDYLKLRAQIEAKLRAGTRCIPSDLLLSLPKR